MDNSKQQTDCDHCFCKSGKGWTDNYITCCKCGKTKPVFDATLEGANIIHEFVKKLNKSIQK